MTHKHWVLLLLFTTFAVVGIVLFEEHEYVYGNTELL